MSVHQRLGPAIIVLGIVGLIWGVVGWRRGDSGPTVRAYLVLVAGLVVVEALIGLALLIRGHRPAERLHYVYAVAVALAIPVARRYAAAQRARGEAVVLSAGSLAVVLLGLRAVMTGGG